MDYYRRGVESQRTGDADGALRYFTWAIQRDPSLVEAYVSRGSVYLAQDDLSEALSDADVALELEPSARSYALRGEALRMMGQHRHALEAFDRALARDPSLRGDTLHSRWSAARAAGDADLMFALSEEYAQDHSDDPLRHYYRALAALESGMREDAINVLVGGIGESADPPALLWYLLGQVYSEIDAWPEAVASLETARALVEAGDTSLALHADRPVPELFVALGQAYLDAGRCVDAESMLAFAISNGAPASQHLPTLREAQVCQTPTPNAGANPTETPSTR
jgi:tetratricopeptide (TPR) repeat protein